MIKLTKENYYSEEANREFMSVSTLKRILKCEAEGLAFLQGKIPRADKSCFLEGSYVHSWSEGTLDKFKEENPQIISSRGATKGELKANFQICDKMIGALEEDKLCMKFLEGGKEEIIQGELWGLKWKGMVDVLNLEKGFFSDLKTTQNIYKKYSGLNFIEFYGYDLQMAIYRELIKQQFNVDLIPYIVAVEKSNIPDKAIIKIDKHYTDSKLEEMEFKIERIKNIIEGKEKPVGCGICDYCKATKKVSKILSLEDL